MAPLKDIIYVLKRAVIHAAYFDRDVSRIIATRLAIQRMDDLAYHSQAPGVSKRSVGEEELVVSLTTHSSRILSAHRAVESIFQQSILPHCVVLYVARDQCDRCDQLPIALQRQIPRGLEVRFVQDQGPYTKLLPALHDFPESNIVTVDDDIIYPANLLERLLKSHRQHPEAICSLATKVLRLKGTNRLESYYLLSYNQQPQDTLSSLYVAEGFGGVLYPPHCFTDEVFNAEVFNQLAPTADDLWFKAMSLLHDTPVLSIASNYDVFDELCIDNSLQTSGLRNQNQQNDIYNRQLVSLFDHYQLYDKLRS